jgi:transposase
MDTSLEQLSKQELIALLNQQQQAARMREQEVTSYQQQVARYQDTLSGYEHQIAGYEDEVAFLKAQVEQFKRMLFGQKRERFQANAAQMSLPFQPDAAQLEAHIQQLEEKIEYVRRKRAAKPHPGRVPLPDHLPVEEVKIYPEGDLSHMVCIGSEVTDELECQPARLFIRRYIRYKYVTKDKEGVSIGELPARVVDKAIAGPGLLATLLVDKYMDHLPLYRQRQRFLREGIPIAASTLDGWVKASLEKLSILYESLLVDTRVKGYLQVDETPIRVMDSDKKGATHQGYYWVYHSPIDKTVLFDYQPTRSGKGANALLQGFKGYLQTDGYGVYEKLGKQQGVVHLACMAHARREFDKAKTNDKARAELALLYMQALYVIEQKAREQGLTAGQRKELRLQEALPVLNAMGKWIGEQLKQVLPKTAIGKALRYTAERWDNLCAYLYDGMLEIDNNLVENAIRPVALGRKNYLFAGSHDAARRAAMIYSFFAICKKHEVNPYEWLRHTLVHINATSIQNLHSLYPQNFKNNM